MSRVAWARELAGSTAVLVVALWLVWSTAFVAIKVGLRHADPYTFTLLRVVAALLVLVLAVAVRGRWQRLGSRRLHAYAVALGATNVAGFLVFQNAGLADAPIGVGSVLIYTQPFLVALGAWLLRGETLRLGQVAGMVLGWLGVVIVVVGELDVGSTPARAVVFLLLSALSWAAGTLVFTAVPRELSVLDVLLLMNLYGVVPIALLVAAGVGPGPTADWDTTLVACALWAGAGASIGGLGLQFLLLRRGKAGVVSSWTFAVPVLAAAQGVVLLGEDAHGALLLGGAAVAAGIWLVNRRPAR
ncbi:MAG TPA: DMT family transporter [Nocardioides sp.]|uniref:DMT family transporter n=1 Tax=Nocardioides sp. TaxID=35761 RepID=UPI002E31290A|nr:DMT family transporter [Nocardioides sp.]HEX5089123.1 DMT family transporter [Nocardioides sp.]